MHAVHVAWTFANDGVPCSYTSWRELRIKARDKDNEMHQKRVAPVAVKTTLSCVLGCFAVEFVVTAHLAMQCAGGFIASAVIASPNNLVPEPVHVL